MEFVSHDGRDNVKHNGDGFVEISRIFATQDAFFFGTDRFDGV